MPDLKYIKTHTTHRRSKLPFFIFSFILIVILLIALVIFYKNKFLNISKSNQSHQSESSVLTATDSDAIHAETTDTINSDISDAVRNILDASADIAAGYDYDSAITMITSDKDAISSKEGRLAVTTYEANKSILVRQDIYTVPHVFFHSLIIDTSKAFDGDKKEKSYNQVMTTKDEFLKIMQEMYNRGFVLVSLHDLASESDNTDGVKTMTANDIMLPPGKKAFVLSQDDVCYYEYMEGDGFASRLIIGDDGKPSCEMKLDDGSIVTGSYDLIPLLDDFIAEHPDFSYKGARGVLALTGYNGVFGYRTAPSYSTNPSYESDKIIASQVAQCLKDDGWELASHSWGHRYLGSISYDEFVIDCDKWQQEVAPIIGSSDIILFPFGTDVSDWHKYKPDNQKFQYLWNQGFRYFCTVDSSQYWVQLGDDYFRQGRRNLDGYRMWRDITEPDNKKLIDLFDASVIFDASRPTPVAAMNSGSTSNDTTAIKDITK